MAASGDPLVAAMDDPVEEGPGRQDHRACLKRDTLPRRDTDDAVAVEDQRLGGSGHQGQVGIVGQLGLHGLAVQAAVDLAAGPPHGGALRPIQETELDARLVPEPTHQPVESIDLPYQMALAQAADGGVAAHLADGLELLGQQQGAGAGACRGSRGLAAGMAAADHDDVEGRGGAHRRGHRGKGAETPPTHCFT